MSYIVGAYKDIYTTQVPTGNNCDFTYSPESLTAYVLCVVDLETQNKYEHRLYLTCGECSSGWTTATWGCFREEKVEKWKKSLTYHIEHCPFRVEKQTES